MHFLVVGAGLSGAVLGRELATAGHHVTIIESRSHVAGNCHTERDSNSGILLHMYGPHIFHTQDTEVWSYMQKFAKFRRYRHRVFTTHQNRVYSMPINLLTINQLYGLAMSPAEARAFISKRTVNIPEPRSFEEQALAMVGPEIYDAFFKGYTQKQWGLPPSQIPASVLKRLPLRFSYDDSYFSHPYQGIPEDGYTALVKRILDHPRIDVHLETAFKEQHRERADHVVWTGPLDEWFGHDHGRLGYRTLHFERIDGHGDMQGCAVMNFADASVPYTRITEHKHFAPWETHEGTVLYREFPAAAGPEDVPYYPIRLVSEKAILTRYAARARLSEGVSFAGRLGTYRYLDMDVSVREALDLAR